MSGTRALAPVRSWRGSATAPTSSPATPSPRARGSTPMPTSCHAPGTAYSPPGSSA